MSKSIIFTAALALSATAFAQTPAGVALDAYVGGRAVRNASGYVYQWPGVYFEAQFTGPSVDVKVNDDQNDLYVYVDGAHKLTLTRPGKTTISLKELGEGRHVVRIEKTSETQSSTGEFDGFYVDSAAKALPAPVYAHAIEFIGDSHTVGYGDMSRGRECTGDDVRDTTNTSMAFAPAVAKRLGAAYRIMAFSGRGVVRNYADVAHGETLPVLYDYSLFDKSAPAPVDDWRPEVIVIGLGTNDFSTPPAAAEVWKSGAELREDYVKSYVAFVKKLRAKNPAAHFILLASDAIADNAFESAVTRVASELKASGDANVETLFYEKFSFGACHWHPDLKDEATMTKLLLGRIEKLPAFAK